MSEQWSCLVDRQAAISQWEDQAGVSYLTALPQIIGYAQALLFSQYNQLCFYYFNHQRAYWLYIELIRHQQNFTLIHAQQSELPFTLSKRELEILTLLSSGLSNAEMAQQLVISERTVAKHIENIFLKTEIDNRTALAIFAMTKHLCCLPTPGKLASSILPSVEIEQLVGKNSLQTVPHFAIKHYASRPIIIGVPFVEQGRGEIDTKELLNGTQLAVELINQQGGIYGRQLHIATAGFCVDDKNSILRAYNDLFSQEVDAISTGYACYLPEVHELIATEGIPYLHIATHSGSDKLAHNLSNKRIANMFQVCASDVTYGLGIMRFIDYYQYHYPQFVQNQCLFVVTVKWQKIDVGVEDLIIQLRAKNWRVEYIEVDQADGGYQAVMNQVHSLAPSLIVLASYFAEDIVHFYRVFTQQPTNAVLYSIYAPSAFLPDEQPCEGVLWSTTSGLSNNYLGKRFVANYQALFGYQPTYSQASIAYDQTQILANAWRNNASTRHFKSIAETIRSFPYRGVNGTYYFATDTQIGLSYPDNTQDLSISQPHLVYQVQQGKSMVIAPALFADVTFRLPPWFTSKQ